MHTFKWFQVLLTIQFNISCLFAHSLIAKSSIWPMDGTLSESTSLGQSESESNCYEGVLHIPQSSRIEASPSDILVSYPGHSLERGLTPLQRCSRHILQPQSNGQKIQRNKITNQLCNYRTSENLLENKKKHSLPSKTYSTK